MKKYAGACPGPEQYLDVCCIQSVVSKVKGGSTLYYMTLLARATVFSQRGMAKMLIENGAREWHYRTLAKEGPLQNIGPPPLGLLRSNVYPNMRPCVAAFENAAQMAGL